MRHRLRWFICLSIAGALAAWDVHAEWPTHRGNPQRTGAADDRPGPKAPKVLWVHRTQEQFVAAPVPGDKALYVSGLGTFNTAAFHALALDPRPAGKQVLWTKRGPYLKLPVVSAPAVAEGRLVFGDGMHQTDGAVLHCLRADTGLPLWQLPLAGKLVHLEGAPTITGGKVYMGGGNAGVLCVDLNRVTLAGKELPLAEVQAILDQRWKELVQKYEAEKKKDEFAVPPTEDQLPRPSPRRVWQQGQDRWHVDASVAVVGERVLAASAYLDEEKVGERTLYCLQASDGMVLWKVPLTHNPWAGPTVTDNLVIVGCSNIRFDPKAIPGAKGEVVAVDLTSGAVKWRKPVPGGVVSPVAVRDGVAYFTATDGKVRAWDVRTGAEKWVYDAKAPFFAGPAVAPNAVYVADLRGVVHALNPADGKALWTLDLATDAAVKAPGMVYGSPALHAGRLYLATCNLEGDRARQPTAVICIGEK
jgi:outer membrane protein assembly factor BamB